MSIIRYAHPSHIDELFISGTDSAFYLRGVVKTTFKTRISGLLRVILTEETAVVGGPFNTVEEVFAFIEKHFPEHVPKKVLVHRLVRTRWVKAA